MDPGYRTGAMAATSLFSWNDANARLSYNSSAKSLAERILRDYEAGKYPSDKVAAALAVEERNAALAAAREKLSPGGRAMSEAIKEQGLGIEALRTKYAAKAIIETPSLVRANETTASAIARLAESEAVSVQVMQAAGRTNKLITGLARFNKVAGPAGVAVGVGVSVYEVYSAPEGEKLYVAGREGFGFTGGLIGAAGGGLAAGWVASFACGPALPICAIAVSIVIVGGAGYAGGRLAESGYEGLYGPTKMDRGTPIPGIDPSWLQTPDRCNMSHHR